MTRRERAQSMLRRGLTPAEVACRLGMTVAWVQYGKNYDADDRASKGITEEEIRELHEQGLTMREAAKRLGCADKNLRYWEQKLRIKFRKMYTKRYMLEPKQWEEYRFLTQKKLIPRADALRMVGRADLI